MNLPPPRYIPAANKAIERELADITAVLSKGELLTVKEICQAVCLEFQVVIDRLSYLRGRRKAAKVRLTRRGVSLWTTYHPALAAWPYPAEVTEFIRSTRGEDGLIRTNGYGLERAEAVPVR